MIHPMGKLLSTTVRVGLEKPVRVLHVTDAHLSAWNERDDEVKRDRAQNRRASFAARAAAGDGYVDEFLRLLDSAAHDDGIDVIFNTGDTIDLVSYGTLDLLAEVRRRGGEKLIATPGSHEFSQLVGEATEDLPYKMRSYNAIQNRWPGNVDFCSRVVGGVNFVAMDNSYYAFSERQLYLLQTEAAKGYPIILGLHVPLFNPAYTVGEDAGRFTAAMAAGEAVLPPLYCVGVPEEITRRYDMHRYEEQHSDPITDCVCNYIDTCPAIKAILCGHLHVDGDITTKNGKPMIITDLACRSVRQITLE